MQLFLSLDHKGINTGIKSNHAK